MENILMDKLCDQFNNLKWHDSRLISFGVYEGIDGVSHDMFFLINFVSKNNSNEIVWLLKKLILTECSIAKIDLDLDGKTMCSDSISNAYCVKESELKRKIEKEQLQNELKPLADYYHFNITLIHPGGEINIFAKSFSIDQQGNSGEYERNHDGSD